MNNYKVLNYKRIGQRIKEAREGLGLSQEKLLGVLQDEQKPHFGRNTLSDLENGKEEAFSAVKLSQWEALCEKFNCSIGYLLGEYDSRSYDLQYIYDLTGLSEKAVDKLLKVKEEDIMTGNAEALTHMIETDLFRYLLALLSAPIIEDGKDQSLHAGNALVSYKNEAVIRYEVGSTFDKITEEVRRIMTDSWKRDYDKRVMFGILYGLKDEGRISEEDFQKTYKAYLQGDYSYNPFEDK